MAPTTGARLLETVGQRLREIEAELDGMRATRHRPSGTVRVTTYDHALRTVLWPAVQRLLMSHPDVNIEVSIDYGLTDIVADRFDGGIRLGEMVAKDMVAVRVGPDLRSAVVASPAYFAERVTPALLSDLTAHACINLRLPTQGGVYAWEFERDGQVVRVRVEGRFTCNGTKPMLQRRSQDLGWPTYPRTMLAHSC